MLSLILSMNSSQACFFHSLLRPISLFQSSNGFVSKRFLSENDEKKVVQRELNQTPTWAVAGVCFLSENDEKKVVQRELNQTPTWAVAGVCTFFIVVSVVLEKLIHKVGTLLDHDAWEVKGTYKIVDGDIGRKRHHPITTSFQQILPDLDSLTKHLS